MRDAENTLESPPAQVKTNSVLKPQEAKSCQPLIAVQGYFCTEGKFRNLLSPPHPHAGALDLINQVAPFGKLLRAKGHGFEAAVHATAQGHNTTSVGEAVSAETDSGYRAETGGSGRHAPARNTGKVVDYSMAANQNPQAPSGRSSYLSYAIGDVAYRR